MQIVGAGAWKITNCNLLKEIIKIDNLSSTKVTTLGCQVCRRRYSTALYVTIENKSRIKEWTSIHVFCRTAELAFIKPSTNSRRPME